MYFSLFYFSSIFQLECALIDDAVTCSRVDFVKYPSLKDVEYFNVTMEPGDCLFIPYKW